MKIPAPYKYSKYRMPRNQDKAIRSTAMKADGEVLTKQIDGAPASDLEERFHNALVRNPNVQGYEFQPSFISGRNMPGEIRLDFLVWTGGMLQPVQIDGEFVHKTAEAKQDDISKDGILDDFLNGQGAFPVKRISGEFLQTQEEANAEVKDLFG
jgi:hypothetical protein